MKLSIVGLVLGSMIMAAPQAEARSIQLPRISEAKLTHIFRDSKLKGRAVIGGRVVINHDKETVKVELQPAWSCPPNALCAMVMPQVLITELPVVSTYTDECGRQVTKAMRDQRLVDGNYESLTVIDNRGDKCMRPMHQMYGPTQVIHVVTTAGFSPVGVENFQSTYYGDTLVEKHGF